MEVPFKKIVPKIKKKPLNFNILSLNLKGLDLTWIMVNQTWIIVLFRYNHCSVKIHVTQINNL